MKDKTVTINIFSDDVEIEESHFLLFRFVPYLPLPFFYIINGLEIREFSDNSLKRSKTTFADRQSGGYFLQFFISLLLVLSFAAFQNSRTICIIITSSVALLSAFFRLSHGMGRVFCNYPNLPKSKGIRIYLVPQLKTVLLNIVYVLFLVSLFFSNYLVILYVGENFLTVLIAPIFWGIFLMDMMFTTPITFGAKYRIRKITQYGKQIDFERCKDILGSKKIIIPKVYLK